MFLFIFIDLWLIPPVKFSGFPFFPAVLIFLWGAGGIKGIHLSTKEPLIFYKNLFESNFGENNSKAKSRWIKRRPWRVAVFQVFLIP